jgi:hypothetical protein
VGYDVSAYVLGDVLVDTGFPRGGRALVNAVATLRPRGVVLTHWHEDHAGSAPALAEGGVPMAMHAECEAPARERPPIRFYRRAVWGRTARLRAPLETVRPAPLVLLETPGTQRRPSHRVGSGTADPGVGDLFLGVKVRVAHEGDETRARWWRAFAGRRRWSRGCCSTRIGGRCATRAAQLRAKAAWNEEMIGEIERLAAAGVESGGDRERLFGGESLVGRVSGLEYSRGGSYGGRCGVQSERRMRDAGCGCGCATADHHPPPSSRASGSESRDLRVHYGVQPTDHG